MSPLEITLIIVGIICIVVSCFFIEYKHEETVNTEIGNVTEQLLYSQLSEANNQISKHVSEIRKDAMEQTQDDLSRITNEKIMAVHEYSDQILNDMKKSHDEVMFLYQMMTDKEEEVKSALGEIKKTKREIQALLEHVDECKNAQYVTKDGKNTKKTDEKKQEEFTKTLKDIEEQEFASHIEEILSFYQEGYSVVEISKKLGLGQGEVQLVIDYNTK